MIIQHVALQGDCVESIAGQYNTTPDRILNLDQNADLFQRRTDPNVLFPGDVVQVPREPKDYAVPTGTRQKFCVSVATSRLKIRVIDCLHLPRKNVPFILIMGDQQVTGKTDNEGNIDQPIPAQLASAQLLVGEEADPYDLTLGAVDPVDAISGIQARLNNLGHDAGPEDGVLGPQTQAALCVFQTSKDLEATGQPDDATLQALLEVHGQ